MRRLSRLSPLLADLLGQGCEKRLFSGGAAAVFTTQEMVTAVAGLRSCDGDALQPSDWFDLASLTKPLCTTLVIADLAGRGALDIDAPLATLFPPGKAPDTWRQITTAMLLAHTSGLAAWRPYHQELEAVGWHHRKPLLLNMLAAEPLESAPGEQTCYSDLGFLLLGLLAEHLSGTELDTYAAERVYRPLGVDLFCNRTGPVPAIRPGRYLATSQYGRGQRPLAGEVHDDNARSLGGVAGHAGLFGSIGAVAGLLQQLLRAWLHNAPLADIPAAIVARFCDHPGPRALGFDRPSPSATAPSSAGTRLSGRSIGHLGFTGTSFWLDPELGTGIALLTNRVHMATSRAAMRQYRAWFHDRVVEGMTGGKGESRPGRDRGGGSP